VFLDESAVNKITLQRHKEWAPIGATALVIWPFKCSEHWSILSAYTKEGFIIHDIMHSSFMAKMFNDFVEHNFLLLCSPFPGPRSIIVVDNYKIHYNDVSRFPCL